jgi:hypothetical protein
MAKMNLRAQIYILGTILFGAGLLVWQLFTWDPNQVVLVTGLCALASLSLIFKVVGTTERSHYNYSFLIYGFTLVLLGLPETLVVILILTWWSGPGPSIHGMSRFYCHLCYLDLCSRCHLCAIFI